MSYLIQTAETNAFLQLAKFVADLLDEGQGRSALAETAGSKFVEDSETFIAKAQNSSLLRLLLSQAQRVFSKAAAADVDTYVSLITPHLLARVSEQDAPALAEELCTALAAEVDEHAETRLQGLTQVFNTLSQPEPQLKAFTATCAYAQRAGLTALLSPVIKASMDAWLRELTLGPDSERRMLLAGAELLRSSKKRQQRSLFARDAFRFTQRALLTLQAGDDASSPEVQEAAAAVIIDFVRFADVFQFDLADCPAVTALKGHSKHAALHSLLHLLLDADVKGLVQWTEDAGQSAPVLEACQISANDVLTKGRLMALLALGAQGPAIPLPTVQEKLACSEEEVEGWVVRAIGRKLLEARIDQLQRLVTITRTTQRTFSPKDWGRLASQLQAWQGTVEEIKGSIAVHQPVAQRV